MYENKRWISLQIIFIWKQKMNKFTNNDRHIPIILTQLLVYIMKYTMLYIGMTDQNILRKICFHFLSNWMGYDRGDSFFFRVLNQMEFHLVQNWKENCHNYHIPFNLKGNGNIFISVYFDLSFLRLYIPLYIPLYILSYIPTIALEFQGYVCHYSETYSSFVWRLFISTNIAKLHQKFRLITAILLYMKFLSILKFLLEVFINT